MKREEIVKNRHFLADNRWFLPIGFASLIAGAILVSNFIKTADYSFLCSIPQYKSQAVAEYSPSPIQLEAIIHYATSHLVPQQTIREISVTFDVLKERSPCNFLVFGLGYDSLMWTSLNPHGKTIFLEEDPKWVQIVLNKAPSLHAYAVNYTTKLKEADDLLSHYLSEPNCYPSKAYLRGNEKCRLALTGFPDEFYETEWDLIMIDAPRGFYAEGPGRMAPIFSAAVMARNRKGSGVTHVFLHDANRKVEKAFSQTFLCRKYLVRTVGRLWHFEIPPAANMSYDGARFCV